MNQKNWIIGSVILVVVLVSGVTFFVVGKKSIPVAQQPSPKSTQTINTSKPSSTRVPATSLLDTIKNYIKSQEEAQATKPREGLGGGNFCYTGPSLDSISADEKDSNLLPNLFVEDIKTETRLATARGGDKVPVIFVFAKIKNSGKTINDSFFNKYNWTYLGDSRVYEDLSGMGPIFSNKYSGGIKDPTLENGNCENGYPWTPIKFDVKSGDKVTIILDSNNEIKESNESDNEFVYTIK